MRGCYIFRSRAACHVRLGLFGKKSIVIKRPAKETYRRTFGNTSCCEEVSMEKRPVRIKKRATKTYKRDSRNASCCCSSICSRCARCSTSDLTCELKKRFVWKRDLQGQRKVQEESTKETPVTHHVAKKSLWKREL